MPHAEFTELVGASSSGPPPGSALDPGSPAARQHIPQKVMNIANFYLNSHEKVMNSDILNIVATLMYRNGIYGFYINPAGKSFSERT